MTWLDERLFGWSQSSRRGTSVWSGSAADDASRMASRVGSPDISDDEDAGDYDNVVGVIDDHHLSAVKSRSRNSSFADLQRLRMAGLSSSKPPVQSTATGVAEHEDSHLTSRNAHSPHARRMSLTDAVPVERIAALDRQEPFDEATHDLNEEISHIKSS